jgi:uncharacterized protein
MNNERERGHFVMSQRSVDLLVQVLLMLFIAVTVYVTVLSVNGLRSYRHIGISDEVQDVIRVTGQGEVFAVPDTAVFSFSVAREAETVPEAQESVNESMETILQFLKENGVEDADITTVNYSVYPRYEYRQATADREWPGPEGSRVLVGYEVTQSILVKVRAVADAGALLSGVGGSGASNVGSLMFTVDDEDGLKRDARKAAIQDAKSKARDLSRDLGVRLVKIVNYAEFDGGHYFPSPMKEAFDMERSLSSSVQLPAGENRISSTVEITYQIR